MKKCKSCKMDIDEKATKCPHCQTDQRNWFIRHPVISVIIVIILIGLIGSANKSTTSNSTTTAASGSNNGTAATAAAETPTPTVDAHPHFTDGTYTVGKDIQPGLYRTRTASSSCYYERLSGFGGTLGEIIANDNTDDPAIVEIDITDKGFKSSNCGTWTQDVSRITASMTSFGDGMYIVGTDIQPGTYKSSDQSGCYYERLSNFSGAGTDGIISNDNTNTAAIITIAATDKGFKSSSCGTWTLQE